MTAIYATSAEGLQFSLSNAAVGSTVETIGDDEGIVIGPGQSAFVTAYITNTGAALTDFVLQFLAHPGATWDNILSGADWATATSLLVLAASGLNTLASGSADTIQLHIRSAHAFRFRASCGTSTAATIKGTIGFEGGVVC